MSSNIPDICTKWQNYKGTLIHCLWECSDIQKFWKDVINCLSERFNLKIPHCAKLCVLGIYPTGFSQTKKHTRLLDFGLLHARTAISTVFPVIKSSDKLIVSYTEQLAAVTEYSASRR